MSKLKSAHMKNKHRKLSAIFFSDIAGFTSLMGSDEQRALEMLRKNREIQMSTIEKHRGKWLKEMGDGVLAMFKSAYDAVQCALEIQEIASREMKEKIRIGIHLGDVTIENDDIFGDGVNIASRLESIADPGGIYVSEMVYKAIRSNVEIMAGYIGEVALKNVVQPVGTYYIMADHLPLPVKEKIKSLAGKSSLINLPLKLILSLVFVSLLLFLGYYFIPDKYGPGTNKNITLAVLPFDNLSGDPEQEYFSDAMTEALIANLAKISALTVISRTSAMLYKDSNKLLPEIAKELDADVVIEGSVIRDGDQVRITAQLIDSKSDKHLWADTYDRDMTNILQLQSEVAQAIANEIQINITPDEKASFETTDKINPQAYEAYLKGRHYVFKLNPDDYDIAMQYYKKAIAIDPNYAEPYIGLAQIWLHRGLWGGVPPNESIPIAQSLLDESYKIAAPSTEAAIIQASIKYSYSMEYEESEREFLKALELNPNNVDLHLFYGDLLLSLKRFDEAISQLKKGLELDPLNPFSYCMMGWGYLANDNLHEAKSNLEKSIIMTEDLSLSLRCLWTLNHVEGKEQEALTYAERFYRSQGLSIAAETISRSKADLNYRETMKLAAEALVAESKERFIPSMRIARLYVSAGETDLAFSFLEKSIAENFASNASLNVDPHWRILSDDPRFLDMIREMQLPL